MYAIPQRRPRASRRSVRLRFGLRSGLTVGDATDLVLMLSSSSPYLTLEGYGWSEQKYVDWLTDALASQLLARPGRRKDG